MVSAIFSVTAGGLGCSTLGNLDGLGSSGSVGGVMVFFTTGGFSTGGLGGGGFTGGKVIVTFGSGLGGGKVMGRVSCTTTSRNSSTLRCTGAVCNNSQIKAICIADTASNAGRDRRWLGGW